MRQEQTNIRYLLCRKNGCFCLEAVTGSLNVEGHGRVGCGPGFLPDDCAVLNESTR